ncbi:MAG: DUF5990 family protein [Gemmatimonadota bacterium]
MAAHATDVLALRIIVRDPVPGVALRMQSGQFNLIEPTSASPTAVVFDFNVRVSLPESDGPVGFYGPVTQGPPAKRFVYINVGSYAGQDGGGWNRRAKIPLTGISAELVRRALAEPGSVLKVSIAGRGRDGTPVCASVKVPPDAWQLGTS